MGKKKLMALLMAMLLCLNTSIVFAGSYENEYSIMMNNQDYGDYKVIARCTEYKNVYGYAYWNKSGGRVQVSYETYIDAGYEGLVPAQYGITNPTTTTCSISHVSTTGYQVLSVQFMYYADGWTVASVEVSGN